MAKPPVTDDGAHFFQPNEIRSATDADFEYFIHLADQHGDGWVKKLDRNNMTIWQKETGISSIKMAKICGEFEGVSAGTTFDTILDGQYRKTWDDNCIDDFEYCKLDDWNDVGYYSMKCPAPLKNRDFVNQRSWRVYGQNQFVIFNHSVSIKALPLDRRFVRGISYITGFLLRNSEKGCVLNYVTQSDPKGRIPSWIINMTINKIAPSVFKKLHIAASKYEDWKSSNNPGFKPWLYPQQNELKLMDPSALVNGVVHFNVEMADQEEEESPVNEEQIKELVDSIAKKLELETSGEGVNGGLEAGNSKLENED